MSVVLNASALLAMLQGERGGSKVASVIAGARIGVVNYTEVVSHFIRLGMPAADVDTMLDPLLLDIVPADRRWPFSPADCALSPLRPGCRSAIAIAWRSPTAMGCPRGPPTGRGRASSTPRR